MRSLYEKMIDENVILDGHWILHSGRHAQLYVSKDKIYKSPNLYKDVVDEMSYKMEMTGINFDVVTGPAVAGAIIASPVSLNLGKVFVYPEKKMEVETTELPMMDREVRMEHKIVSKEMEFRRGYDKDLNGKRVFLTEDVITTGDSVEQTVRAIRGNGGIVVGVFAIWNRTNWKLQGVPTYSLIDRPVESWTEDECPLCGDPKNPLRDPKMFG